MSNIEELGKLLKDLKVLPREPYIFLAAFLPGLFLEISILLANPDPINRLAQDLDKKAPTGHYYALLSIALFLAFVIGTGFMGVTAFIQLLFGYAYQLLNFLWKEFCKVLLLHSIRWLLKRRSYQWLFKAQNYALTTGIIGSDEWKAVQGCWEHFARGLLKTRYGIDPNEIEEEEWKALFWTLGSPTFEEMRGNIVMIASHATGWSGLAATLFAPALSNRYYVGFCLILIFNGFIHDFFVTVRHFDQRIAGYMNIRAILREFPKPPRHD